jgi:hypothetical protein
MYWIGLIHSTLVILLILFLDWRNIIYFSLQLSDSIFSYGSIFRKAVHGNAAVALITVILILINIGYSVYELWQSIPDLVS